MDSSTINIVDPSLPRFTRIAACILDVTTIVAINIWVLIYFGYTTLEFLKENSILEDLRVFVNNQKLQLIACVLAINYIYLVIYPLFFKGTVGLRFFKLKIINSNFKKCSIIRMHLRLLSWLINIPTLFLGYLPPIILKKRTLSDIMSGTAIIKDILIDKAIEFTPKNISIVASQEENQIKNFKVEKE